MNDKTTHPCNEHFCIVVLGQSAFMDRITIKRIAYKLEGSKVFVEQGLKELVHEGIDTGWTTGVGNFSNKKLMDS